MAADAQGVLPYFEKGKVHMIKLTPPKHPTFIIAIVLGAIAVLLQVIPDFGFHQYTFPVAMIGLALLALGNLIENL
jgi:hypothetical protein